MTSGSGGNGSDCDDDAITLNRSTEKVKNAMGSMTLKPEKSVAKDTDSSDAPFNDDVDEPLEEQCARSSFSSPGKFTYRDRLRQRLSLRTRLERKKSRSRSSSFRRCRNKNKCKNNSDANSIRTEETNEGSSTTEGDNNNKTPTANKMKVRVLHGQTNLSDDLDSDDDIRLDRTVRNCSFRRTADNDVDNAVVRLSRQVRYGRRGQFPPLNPTTNNIRLHIYDLVTSDSVMDVMGCNFPIGKCLGSCNDGLHALGTGVYHCGVEVNGIEYAYGMNDVEGASGVFTCIPKHSPGYEYRQTLNFGDRRIAKKMWITVQKEREEEKKVEALPGSSNMKKEEVFRQIDSYIDGRTIMQTMASEYKGLDYDLLRKNCCTFARDACLRLGVKEDEIPNWFMNLAGVGAQTQDSLKPLQGMLTFGPEELNPSTVAVLNPISPTQAGFEVIAQNAETSHTEMEIVRIEEAVADQSRNGKVGLRRTLSWTY
mmetsp:Transcript_15587/g.24250  ORF Transcript_15587/g.24250 Transcript_15587/m.24250 type:complete len:482 (-) Transcript_15587:450-1895(-)